MKSKEEIKQLIATGKTKKALQALMDRTQNTSLYNEVLQQSSMFERYVREKRSRLDSTENSNLYLNQINNALLAITDDLPENIVLKRFKTNLSKPDDGENIKDPKRQRYLIYTVIVLSIFIGIAELLNFINLFPDNSKGNSTNTITVLAHGKNGIDDRILPNRGVVYLHYGDAKIPEQINNEGEATFKQIPDIFFSLNASVRILFEDPEGEPYRVENPDSTYILEEEKSIYLKVLLGGMEEIHGIAKDFETGEGLDSVIVRIFGVETYSNKYGEYKLKIPADQQKQFVTIRAYKEGYETWGKSKIPTTTEQEIIIAMKRK